jgi:hypothetical protein
MDDCSTNHWMERIDGNGRLPRLHVYSELEYGYKAIPLILTLTRSTAAMAEDSPSISARVLLTQEDSRRYFL